MEDKENINFVRPETGKIPSIPLPLYGYGTGTITHHPGVDQTNREIPDFVELIWSIEGTGEVSLYGSKFEMRANDVFYYLPGEQHYRRAISDNWRVRWLCFDGPFAASIMLSYHYPRCQHSSIPYPEETFAELEELISSTAPYDIRTCSAHVLQILACAGGYGSGTGIRGSLIDRALYLVSSHLSDFSLDVQLLCDELQISKSKLTRLFNQEVGVSPGRYILNRRLEQAQTLLLGSTLPIHKVAEECGFSEPQAFLKFIHRALGDSPLKIRQKHANHDKK
jgi:AraC-like DNA-binding protein